MKTIVIMNPWANRGGASKQKSVIEKLCAAHQIELAFTQKAGDANRMAAEAVGAGYELVAAAGGDGTIHEVLNGIYTTGGTATLGVIPIGSGNDLAYSLRIPRRVEQAFERLLHGTPTPIDLARIEDENGRFAVVDNNIGIGFDAQVVIETEAITRVGGFLLYLIAALQTLSRHYHPYRLEVQFDDELIKEDALFVAFGVGSRGGGGFLFNPDATHFDNKIDSCFVRYLPRLTALRLMPTTLNGSHVTAKQITMRQSETIRIRADKPMPIHVDGEMFAYSKDNVRAITIRSLPQAIRVML